jgi:hypothetical protein
MRFSRLRREPRRVVLYDGTDTGKLNAFEGDPGHGTGDGSPSLAASRPLRRPGLDIDPLPSNLWHSLRNHCHTQLPTLPDRCQVDKWCPMRYSWIIRRNHAPPGVW